MNARNSDTDISSSVYTHTASHTLHTRHVAWNRILILVTSTTVMHKHVTLLDVVTLTLGTTISKYASGPVLPTPIVSAQCKALDRWQATLSTKTAKPHWSRFFTLSHPDLNSLTLRTSQYLFNHFIGRSYRPEPLWKHSSVCSFVFKKNTIQKLSKIHAVWSDYSLIYKISFLEEKQTFNRD